MGPRSDRRHRQPRPRVAALYGVSLTLTDGVRLLLGVISLPTLRRTYWGAGDLGAWCDNQAIAPSTARNLADAVIAIGDYGTGDDADERHDPQPWQPPER